MCLFFFFFVVVFVVVVVVVVALYIVLGVEVELNFFQITRGILVNSRNLVLANNEVCQTSLVCLHH